MQIESLGTTSGCALPALQPVTSAMPIDNCRCWYIDTRNTDIQSLRLCAYNTLPAGEFHQGLEQPNSNLTIQHWSSRLVLRHALSIYTCFSRPPSDWRFNRLASGKLTLASADPAHADVDFSITHTAGVALCAIATGVHIGIDIEPANREFKPELVNRRIFSVAEIHSLMCTHKEQRDALALKLWTSKEACSKTLGLGLAMDFSAMQFRVSETGNCKIQAINAPQCFSNWQLRQFLFLREYFLAVATACPPPQSSRLHHA